MLMNILSLLGAIFLIILAVLFFPLIFRILIIIAGIILVVVAFFGLATIAFPIILILLGITIIYQLITYFF
jgi:hypothetical protein